MILKLIGALFGIGLTILSIFMVWRLIDSFTKRDEDEDADT